MKGVKYFLDTNIFLRAIVNDHKAQFEECKKVLHEVHDGALTVVTSPIVLAEIQWTLKSFYKLEKTQIILAIESILAFKHLKIIEKPSTSRALDLYKNFSVKFVDCLIASIPDIQSGKMRVVSYDKDFDVLGVKRVEPKALIK